MPLVVEDGTGRDDAEAYASVRDLLDHANARGLPLAGAPDDGALEIALRRATDFIDTGVGRYKARRLRGAQALEFPREGLTDDGGHVIEGVPHRVRRACLDLAIKSLAEDLQPDLDRGGRIVSESVGPISTTYAADAPAGKLFALARGLLAPFLRAEGLGDLCAPGFTPPGPALFALGMHDAPQGAED